MVYPLSHFAAVIIRSAKTLKACRDFDCEFHGMFFNVIVEQITTAAKNVKENAIKPWKQIFERVTNLIYGKNVPFY